MNDNERQFEDFVSNIKFDDIPDPDHRNKLEQDLLRVLTKQPRHKQQPLKIWRIIMKTKMAKSATAAVIIVAFVLSITFFNNSTSKVWAIEQSIEALSRYNAILFEGSELFLGENGQLQMRDVKTWTVANEDQTKVEKERHEVDGVPTIVTNGVETWRYDPQTNTVIKNRPYGTPESWIGSHFFEQLSAFHEEGVINDWKVTYGKDPVTGRQRIFLTVAWFDKRYNGPRSMWFEFDVESKLLVSMKQWENSNWEGPSRIVSEKITYYENLPDELFEFEIPEGAKVIEE